MAMEIVILAAGMGTRMNSAKPKILHEIAGQSMLGRVVATARSVSPQKIRVVVGKGADQVRAAFAGADDLVFVDQAEQLGTGHAAMQALPDCDPDARVAVLCGDVPLLPAETLIRFAAEPCDLGILSVDVPDPRGYGRLVMDADGKPTAIVEQRDATPEQQQICEINTGVMIARASDFMRWLQQTTRDNDQQEYLMTDIVSVALGEGCAVRAIKADDPDDVQGVNDHAQLNHLERVFQRRQALALQKQGVRILDPSRFDLRGEMTCGQDVSIDVNVVFEGAIALGNNVVIGPNCHITDATIGDGSVIKPNTVIEGATIFADCSVGPFARIRPGSVLNDEVAIGNFVEVKKSTLGKGTKASHLAYLGDATIGARVNIGAGTITCNYDGVDKHQTNIEDDVFVGTNSSLVAPVTIRADATIGAGSTITKEVPPGTLAIGRGRQVIIEGWEKPSKGANR